jgi:very-short-patch-repair endonuclease
VGQQRRTTPGSPALGALSGDHDNQPRPEGAARSAREVDVLALALATRQGGVFGHRQLLAIGLSRDAIAYRRRSGRYVDLHRGVYALAGAPIGFRGRQIGALLAGGPTSAVTHRMAAAHWHIRAETPPGEITVPGPRRRSRPDLIIHTQPPFGEGDVVLRDGIRVSSPLRTLLDLAGVDPPEAVARAAAEAQVLGLVTADQLRAAARHHRPGVARLLDALGDARGAPSQSELERRMRRLIDAAGLPRPLQGAVIAGHRADFAWPEHKLIVEVDGWDAHGTRAAFERDRARDVAHALAGFQVARFTGRRIGGAPLAVAADLGALLAAKPT